ncbi:hypothetical protein GCM10029992_65650 [Glycomyces albus]
MVDYLRILKHWIRWTALTAAVVMTGVSCSAEGTGGDFDASESAAVTSGEAVESESSGDGSEDSVESDGRWNDEEFYPEFESITVSGSGDDEIEVPASMGIISASYEGEDWFKVQPQTSIGEDSDFSILSLGPYDGSTPFGVYGFSGETSHLAVEAKGEWVVIISPISDAPELPESVDGSKDAVYWHSDEASEWRVTPQDEFRVYVYFVPDGTAQEELLANSPRAFEDPVSVSGVGLFIVRSTGDWSISST